MVRVGSRYYHDVLLYAFLIGDPQRGEVGVGPGTDSDDAKRRMQPQAGNQTLTLLNQMPITQQTLQAVMQVRQAQQRQPSPRPPSEYDSESTPHRTGPKDPPPFTPKPFGSMGGKVQ